MRGPTKIKITKSVNRRNDFRNNCISNSIKKKNDWENSTNREFDVTKQNKTKTKKSNKQNETHKLIDI